MKISKSKKNNIIFLIAIALIVIPQTRQPIQVLMNKGLALFSPSVIDSEDRKVLDNYSWKFEDSKGNVFNYESTKGKVVLINFWATWCPPCIAEMPSLQNLYNNYKDEIVFLFVTNEDNETISNFVKKNDYSFKAYRAISDYPQVFNVSSIPRTFLIDKKGNIVIDKTGASNWNSKKVRITIDELLNEH